MEERLQKVCADVAALAEYGVRKGLIEEQDRVYTVNSLLHVLRLDTYEEPSGAEFRAPENGNELESLLNRLTDYAAEAGLLKSKSTAGRDLFDTALMGVLTPRPSEVTREFRARYAESPQAATDWFYRFCRDTNYIRTARVARDIRWSTESPYGAVDISINLSKPEKDPRDIAAARSSAGSAYPKCQLCMENEGYAGRLDHPARENHRIIPITINRSDWGLQYSPYVYYNEHCIALNGQHVPMKIDRSAFRKLFDFVEQFPHYFLGSNADLPIVGGSILAHDHFQGGRYEFAMARAGFEKTFTVPGFEDVEAGVVHWPLSVIRIRSTDNSRLVDLATHILEAWRGYTDEAAFVFAQTDGEPHNTITPIARCRDGVYELDLALRNNIRTEEYPLGVYHPHPEYHHIKKENIGLIEVMGLAILPSRLRGELDRLGKAMLSENMAAVIAEDESLEKHRLWAEDILSRRTVTADTVDAVLREETGQVFVHCLEDAGVYKCTPEGRRAFDRFLAVL